jgi:hypothetical protein
MSAGSAKTPSGIVGPTFCTASRRKPASRSAVVWSFFAILVMALSLGPSFAHLLEAPPRLTAWPPELWREATVFHGQFAYFAIVGAPLDVGAIALAVKTAGLCCALAGGLSLGRSRVTEADRGSHAPAAR